MAIKKKTVKKVKKADKTVTPEVEKLMERIKKTEALALHYRDLWLMERNQHDRLRETLVDLTKPYVTMKLQAAQNG